MPNSRSVAMMAGLLSEPLLGVWAWGEKAAISQSFLVKEDADEENEEPLEERCGCR